MKNRREFWEEKIGPGKHFKTRTVAALIGKSTRTVQRYVQRGWLRALGGSDLTSDHARILREDLVTFLLWYEGNGERWR